MVGLAQVRNLPYADHDDLLHFLDHHGLVMNNGSPMSRRPAMEHLQKLAPRDPPLEDSLTVVGQLHGHFYNKHMSEAQHTEAMAAYILFSST